MGDLFTKCIEATALPSLETTVIDQMLFGQSFIQTWSTPQILNRSPNKRLDHKDWDTYLSSAVYAYNISLSKTTGDTPFFLTYGREPVKLPDVALLLLMTQPRSVDYHREQLIRQIRTARRLAAECTQQARQRIKLYYNQHAKDHPFRVGHKVWIYYAAVKQGL